MSRGAIKYSIAALLLFAATSAAAFTFWPENSVSSAARDTSTLPLWAKDIVSRVAAANGDPSPTTVQFSLTTPARAATLADEASTDDATEVYAVVMCGDFIMYTAHLPQGIDPFPADWIALVIEPNTQEVLSLMASGGEPDLSGLSDVNTTTL